MMNKIRTKDDIQHSVLYSYDTSKCAINCYEPNPLGNKDMSWIHLEFGYRPSPIIDAVDNVLFYILEETGYE